MPHTLTKTVYYFDELSDRAKERARDWYREASVYDFSEFGAASVIEDAVRMAGILGITIATHPVKLLNGTTRQEPTVYWELHVQGAGACFVGTYDYAKGAHRAIRREAPEDTDLHTIADRLLAVQRVYAYSLSASITHRGGGAHEHATDITIDRGRGPNEISGEHYTELQGALRAFMRWIYRQLDREYDYQSSDEVIDENIIGNEYEFDEEGRRSC
jgi:hypothetical protein